MQSVYLFTVASGTLLMWDSAVPNVANYYQMPTKKFEFEKKTNLTSLVETPHYQFLCTSLADAEEAAFNRLPSNHSHYCSHGMN